MSLIRWTVSGFPNPQQFQLMTAKEDPDRGGENPPLGYFGSLVALHYLSFLGSDVFVELVVGTLPLVGHTFECFDLAPSFVSVELEGDRLYRLSEA